MLVPDSSVPLVKTPQPFATLSVSSAVSRGHEPLPYRPFYAPATSSLRKNVMESSHPIPSRPRDAPVRLWYDNSKQRWSKDLGGRRYRFGSRGCDYAEALEDFHARFGGRPADARSLKAEMERSGTLTWLVNLWANRQLERAKRNEISPATWRDYQRVATEIAEAVGQTPLRQVDGRVLRRLNAHYESTVGPQRRRKLIHLLLRILHWGRVERMLEIPPTGDWRGPSKAEVRRWRAGLDSNQNITAAAIWDIVTLAPTWVEAAVLLGINCGYSNSDIGFLKFHHLKQAGEVRFIDFPRPKTSIERISPLWPETIEAIEAMLAERVKPGKGFEDLVFLSTAGTPVDGNHLQGDRPIQTTTLSQHWRKWARRSDRGEIGGFRRLRSTFATVAHDAGDPVAVDYLMGHATREMRNVYVGGASWDRLIHVTDRVREWYLSRGDIEATAPRPGDGADEVQTGWS